MADPVKILSSEVYVTNTAVSNVSSASLVRLINLDGANNCVIQIASNTSVVKGTFTLGQHGSDFGCEYVVKLPSDTITILGAFTAAAGIIRATSVGYI